MWTFEKIKNEIIITVTLLSSFLILGIGLKYYPPIRISYLEVINQAIYQIETYFEMKIFENTSDYFQGHYNLTENILIPGLIYLLSFLLAASGALSLMKYKLNTENLISTICLILLMAVSTICAVYFAFRSISFLSLTLVYFSTYLIFLIFVVMTSLILIYILLKNHNTK